MQITGLHCILLLSIQSSQKEKTCSKSKSNHMICEISSSKMFWIYLWIPGPIWRCWLLSSCTGCCYGPGHQEVSVKAVYSLGYCLSQLSHGPWTFTAFLPASTGSRERAPRSSCQLGSGPELQDHGTVQKHYIWGNKIDLWCLHAFLSKVTFEACILQYHRIIPLD